MKLVLLHGPPAVGKLTVARSLTTMTGARVFDNHASIDVARTVFDFGAPGFWDLVHDIRYATIAAAAQQRVPVLLTTMCYDHPDDLPVVERFESVIAPHDGTLCPVYLTCAQPELERRVSHPDRVSRRKLSSIAGLGAFQDENNITAIPRKTCLRLDTTTTPAPETARRICAHFTLS